MGMTATEVRTMVEQYLFVYRLEGWTVKVSRGVRVYGYCDYSARTIAISGRLAAVNDVETTRETVLHEIAHALVGPGYGHGIEWQDMAVAVGAKPERCYGDEVSAPTMKWTVACNVCGFSKGVARRTKGRSYSCPKCHPHTYNPKFMLEWRQNY